MNWSAPGNGNALARNQRKDLVLSTRATEVHSVRNLLEGGAESDRR